MSTNGTFRGHNPAFVTGAAALERFWCDDMLSKDVGVKSLQLTAGLGAIADRYEGAQVRGRGMLLGIAFDDYSVAGKVSTKAFERALLVETSGPEGEVIKVTPALTTDSDDLRRGIEILAEAVDKTVA